MFEHVLAITGAIGAIASILAPLFPVGSKIGYYLAKVGTDLKGHTVPASKQ
jgi:hypothetical protein